jgi:hypothetical protein
MSLRIVHRFKHARLSMQSILLFQKTLFLRFNNAHRCCDHGAHVSLVAWQSRRSG